MMAFENNEVRPTSVSPIPGGIDGEPLAAEHVPQGIQALYRTPVAHVLYEPRPVIDSTEHVGLDVASDIPKGSNLEGLKWGETTDPNKHDPENFRYVVHAINPWAGVAQASIELAELMHNPRYIPSKQHGDQTIDLAEEPQRVADRISLSMSLIDQDHMSTWGSTGLILDVPEENVLLTSPHNLYVSNSNIASIRERSLREPKYDAQTIIDLTEPNPQGSHDKINEIVAYPRTKSGEIAVKGFFSKTTYLGIPLDPHLHEKLENHSERLGLPFLKIDVAERSQLERRWIRLKNRVFKR